MGWMNEDTPGHDGWPVALQKDEQRGLPMDAMYRVLAYPADNKEGLRVDAVQGGCDCGWRSARIDVTPGRVRWFPFSAELPQYLEDRVHALWRAHVDGLSEGREDQMRRQPTAAAGTAAMFPSTTRGA